ncbi:hypothetical protein N7517_010747 [Penicillium concentricum]|uniref:Uncharacterized protein n=1 Tax=Penicillium concentricum TaxID=293559 RepID=A0A9W9USR3_9EURO|nr:uncharacterized protein N7517_010747 [Penicillium concentricum]KAJ5356138.1 hypothetical protein N7517_010747 [Penicillium concentricum]
MARIGGRSHTLKYDDNFIQFYAADIKRQSSQFKNEHIGFIVHAHCWALLNHVIPTTLVEKKMDKFICVAQDYWRDNKSWGSTSSPLRLEKYSGKCLGSMPRWKYGSDIYKNPLIVSGVQKAIDTAKKYKQRHIQPRCSNYSNVPLDIAILIAEWICPIDYTPADVRNTRNMLSAWQWELPDGFWKRWLREEDIIFELEAPREVNYSIDWQSLRLDLMALVSDRRYVSSGLVNRVRVLGFMTAIASDFLDMH